MRMENGRALTWVKSALAAFAIAWLPAALNAQVATDAPELVAGALPTKVEKITIHSEAIAGNLEGNPADREVFVVLPPSYATEPERRYPVVYALHGFWIDARQWMGEIHMPQTAEGAFAKGTPEMILVLPSSKTRHLGSQYASGVTVGDFERFVADELISYIDANYRTVSERGSRGLVGHSMGGYGAARIGIKHADTFGALYLMSPGGLKPGPMFKIEPALAGRLHAIESVDELADLPNEARGPLALSAAFAPNPNNAPLYLDFPFDTEGNARPEILVKFAANAPLAFIDQYIGGLRSYRAIGMDVGDEDWLLDHSKAMDAALTEYGIDHEFAIYEGDHTNRLAFRMQDHVLPFFGANLIFPSETQD